MLVGFRTRGAPILGPLSLEHTWVDLTDIPCAGVVMIGPQGENVIEVEEVNTALGFGLKAELAMAARESVPRIYI